VVNVTLSVHEKHFACAMAFTEHMTGLAITRQVYMNANEIKALQARLRKQHWGGTFDILDAYLKEERHLQRGRFLLRYQ
jgi:hypothetical protein